MKQDRVVSLLGLAAKAGKVSSGEFACEKAVKTGQAFLVVLAGDASDNTKKKFTDMCSYYQVDCLAWSDKETLGHGLGKEFRACAAVLDAGLAEAVKKAHQQAASSQSVI